MFTGLVQDLGKVIGLNQEDSVMELVIESQLPASAFKQGASIAVNGVCLTVEAYREDESVFQVSVVQESLDRTNLGSLKPGSCVNLEASLTLQDALGGHLVSGHVDGLAEVLQAGEEFIIKIPEDYVKYCPTKGSICLNGVSLTIAEANDAEIRIALIPETLKVTNLGSAQAGDMLNLEIDSIARYLEHLNKYS